MDTKKCSKCNEVKNVKNFGKANASKDGLMYYCKDCNVKRASKWNKENKDRFNKRNRESGTNRTQKKRDRGLYYKYGITAEEYNSMLKDQGGVCAICKKFRLRGKQRRMHVDHCHTTNKVRGILCAHCNTGIGKFEEDVKTIKEAIKYLNKKDKQ